MARNGSDFLFPAAYVNGMTSTLPQEIASVLFEMADNIFSFQTVISPNSSFIISIPFRSSSAS